MEKLLKYKGYSGEGFVKDLDMKNRVVTGYLSRFGNKDHDGDVMQPKAFDRSLQQRRGDIFFLNQHRWDQPHGKFAVLKADNMGLYFESEPLIDTSYSMDALKLYEAGIVREHSIGFSIIESNYNHDEKTQYIEEVKLYEGSNVTLGANSDTPFLGFKSLTLKDCENHIKKIVKLFRNGTLTDEGFMQLEIALKQLQRQAYELALKEARDAESGPAPQTPPATKGNASLIEIINAYKPS